MNQLVDTSIWQYAVIAVRTEPDRERLVIAYPNEKALRDLIAAPSIVALGYSSREEALANVDRCVPTTAASRQKSNAAIVDKSISLLKEFRAGTRRLVGSLESTGTPSIIRNVLQNGVAAAVLLFYSRKLLSSTVRAFISF